MFYQRGDFCFVLQGRHFSYLNRELKEAQLCLVHTPSFDLESEVFPERSDGVGGRITFCS